jgi:hypothetical protein
MHNKAIADEGSFSMLLLHPYLSLLTVRTQLMVLMLGSGIQDLVVRERVSEDV